ncbi:MAG: 8-amino-7-oxononanoate synthase [Alphaproteobacteria bacterium]|nr:8-amino-7-oxononanoate synthase [Alphaproteobacteria bacterium]
MTSLDDFARRKLVALESESLRRSLHESVSVSGQRLERSGSGFVNFCSNDYLGLAQDPRLKAAAVAAVERYGAGGGASRLVTGNHPLYGELEHKIAALKGTEAALVFGSGYLANLGAIPALAGEGDFILADELSHACMISGARLSGALVETFRHNDAEHLRTLLLRHRGGARNCLILTEGVFSMDGDVSPLPDIVALGRDFDAWVMTDDAHGLGVIGEGRGSATHWGVSPDIQMGTLSKAVGCYGGYIAASRSVVDLLVNRARSLIYATALPPAVVGAAIAGIDIIAHDKALCAKPVANARAFAAALNLAQPQSSIVPLILGGAAAALAASNLLAEKGLMVSAIRPPTVPDGTARLRITFAADHSSNDVMRLADAVRVDVLPLMRDHSR